MNNFLLFVAPFILLIAAIVIAFWVAAYDEMLRSSE